jgi:hypothetical protein
VESAGRYEAISLMLIVATCLIAMTSFFLYCLFLNAVQECLEKITPHHRKLSPAMVWLNLVPLVQNLWLFVTASRLSDAVRTEHEARRTEQDSDYGKKLGITFAGLFLLTPLIAFLTMLLWSVGTQAILSKSGAVWADLFLPLVGLLAYLPLGGVWLLYWRRVISMSKSLNVDADGLFSERYNSRLELPTGIGLASLLGAGMCFIFMLLLAVMTAPDKAPVPMRFAEGGFDDFGMGSPGEGGQENPEAIGETAPKAQDFAQLPLPSELPQLKDEITNSINAEDPSATTPVSDEKAASYGALSEDIRNKLLNLGQKKGTGGGNKGGPGDGPGSCPGGTGTDSTRARSLRWVLRFKTNNGRDYLNQLHALKAVVMVPKPPDDKEAFIFRDLVNPRPGTLVTEPEWRELSRQIQFCDFKRESVVGIRDALGLDFTPKAFWAFFPRELEAELARMEVAHRGRRSEDIEETVFEVTIRDGRYQMVVREQRYKR